jgi:hypothetical protein
MLMAKKSVSRKQSDDQSDEPASGATWQYKGDGADEADSSEQSEEPVSDISVNWTASEFIAHDKAPSWYLALAIITVVSTAVIYLLTKDKITAAMIIIVGVFFGVLAARKPRELPYMLDNEGLHIGEKQYPYDHLRSFSLVQQDGIESIWLMPLKRFMPILTIYFEPTDEQKIVDVLSQFLPMENHQPDPVDKLLHKIRF